MKLYTLFKIINIFLLVTLSRLEIVIQKLHSIRVCVTRLKSKRLKSLVSSTGTLDVIITTASPLIFPLLFSRLLLFLISADWRANLYNNFYFKIS